jgi:protein-S-isoprenylcysteine O-methyltransferase Ste14
MNIIWPRFLRSAYRREPVASFIVTAGVVEAAIGGSGEHWSLMAFGLSLVGVVIILRWWQRRQAAIGIKAIGIKQRPIYALPPRPSLPELSLPTRKADGTR